MERQGRYAPVGDSTERRNPCDTVRCSDHHRFRPRDVWHWIRLGNERPNRQGSYWPYLVPARNQHAAGVNRVKILGTLSFAYV
jgi:hypothetical protein